MVKLNHQAMGKAVELPLLGVVDFTIEEAEYFQK
jgi:hypothetical protein